MGGLGLFLDLGRGVENLFVGGDGRHGEFVLDQGRVLLEHVGKHGLAVGLGETREFQGLALIR